jgi:hypothetical protein
MSGALQAVYQNQRSFIAPVPIVGSAFGGGFFAGQISTAGNGTADYNLVIGPKSSAESGNKAWKNANTATPGADSFINGPQNTVDMVADGNSTVYPAGHFCNDLVTGGFSDWYMPALNELEICYYNLKPGTNNNPENQGSNNNSVPKRTSNYTLTVPAQTSATDFQTGGTEAFAANPYWASNDFSAANGYTINFGNGNRGATPKNYSYSNYKVRAVRRVAV